MSTIERFMLEDQVVITAVDTKDIAEEGRVLHNTYPVSTAVLGRTLTAAVLLGSVFQNENDKLTVSLQGGGPAGVVLATIDGSLNVKGYIDNPFVELPAKQDGQLDVGGAIGTDGYLTVVRDTGTSEPYIGRTELVSGEVAEDLAYYFLQSEQKPTIVYINTWVDIDATVLTAGGMVISPLPGTSEACLAAIEARISAIKNYGLMLMQHSPGRIVENIFAGMDLRLLEEQTPQYLCDCSAERFERGIISLGKDEIEQMIEEDGQAEVVCRFCNKKYAFAREELQNLLKEAEQNE